MVLLKNFKNIFKIPELTKKLFITLGILIVVRLGMQIPAVGINVTALGQLREATGLGGLLQFLDLFSGGALQQASLFALGIMPYIQASIMMQMLSIAIPYFEQLAKEGEYGKKVISQYTRYLSLAVAVVQSFSYAITLEYQQGLVLTPGWGFRLTFVLLLTTGAMLVMWLGDQISFFGIGEGSSMIIFSGIVANFPAYALQTYANVSIGSLSVFSALFILLVFIAITACIVFLEKGERKIPVQYTRRIVGQRVYGGQSTYIPFKINTPGVMPVIFATNVLQIPLFILSMLAGRYEIFRPFADSLRYGGGPVYAAVMFFLIVGFSFFYTALIYNPEELADNMKKSGGFIPGVRPGKQTAAFFYRILSRLGLVGALYLATLALSPNILRVFISNMPFVLRGTGLLIAVGVALEFAAQLESYLIEHRYEGFLTTGRFKGRGAR